MYTQSAEQGNSQALATLGNSQALATLGQCYEIRKQPSRAFALYMYMYTYLESAQLGNSLGMCNVGTCYENGVGVAKDMNLAKEWYSKAAAQGYDRAQVALGNLSNTA